MSRDFGNGAPPPDLPAEAYADYGVASGDGPFDYGVETPGRRAPVLESLAMPRRAFRRHETPSLPELPDPAPPERPEPEAAPGWTKFRELREAGWSVDAAAREAAKARRGEADLAPEETRW